VFSGRRLMLALRVWSCMMQAWKRRRLVLLRRSSRGPLRLVVIADSGDVEQLIQLNDYTFITRVHQHALAISFRSRPSFRFSTQSGQQQISLLCVQQIHLIQFD